MFSPAAIGMPLAFRNSARPLKFSGGQSGCSSHFSFTGLSSSATSRASFNDQGQLTSSVSSTSGPASSRAARMAPSSISWSLSVPNPASTARRTPLPTSGGSEKRTKLAEQTRPAAPKGERAGENAEGGPPAPAEHMELLLNLGHQRLDPRRVLADAKRRDQ